MGGLRDPRPVMAAHCIPASCPGAVVLITLALCLGVAVLSTQLYVGFREAERALVLHLFGAQQGLFIDAGNDVLDALRRDARVDQLGEAVVTGLATNPASGQSVTVPLGLLDDAAQSLAGVALQEGRWPETESEIAIERITLSTLRLRAGVGDTVVLSVSTSPREDVPGSQPATVQISYHLVGILDNYSFMQYHPNDPDGTLTGLPSLITTGDPETAKGKPSPDCLCACRGSRSLCHVLQRVCGSVRSFHKQYLSTPRHSPDPPQRSTGIRKTT